MNQCFRGSFPENDLQSTGLYSPTHSFHIKWLLNYVPTNKSLSHRYTHTHTMSLLIIHTCAGNSNEQSVFCFYFRNTVLMHNRTRPGNEISKVCSSSMVYDRYLYDKVCIRIPMSTLGTYRHGYRIHMKQITPRVVIYRAFSFFPPCNHVINIKKTSFFGEVKDSVIPPTYKLHKTMFPLRNVCN